MKPRLSLLALAALWPVLTPAQNTPLQSTPVGVPPEVDGAARLTVPRMHSVPPWNGIAARPVTPYTSRPLLLLSTLTLLTTKPEPAVALGVPE